MSFAVLLAVNDFLAYTSLYVLVHIGVGETQQQAVRPFLVYDTQFADDGFVVVGIVEAFHTFLLASRSFLPERSRSNHYPNSFGKH